MAEPLQEFKINIRLKLSSLWTAVMFFYIYGDYFALYIPHQANKLVIGDTLLNSPVKIFAASILMAIPPIVILLSVLARPKLARWMNIISGLFFTAIMLLIAATSIDPDWSAYVFYALVESIITIFIVWYAWKWPREFRNNLFP